MNEVHTKFRKIPRILSEYSSTVQNKNKDL